jgi:hypothetical protein
MEKQNILNKSTINNEKSLLALPIEKIEEYIQILEEFQNKCEVEAKFVEADLAQKKIAQLHKIKNKKKLIDKKNQQIEEKDELERTQKEELDEFNKEQDKKFYELNEKFQEMHNKLEEEHNSQLKALQQKYEEKYSNYTIKPSTELINLNKKLELFVQKKDYKNAHQTQIDIANLTKIEKEKFEKEKFRTIQKEIENLQKKQLNETKGLEQKIQSIYNNFKKNRAIKVQELLLKYKNQFRDLENKQSNDIKNLEKVVQGGMLKQGKSVNYSNEIREKNVNFNRTTGTK